MKIPSMILLGAAQLLWLAFPAFADEGAAAPAPPCLSVREGPLASLLGRWTVDWSYRVAPGEFAESVATAEIVADLHDCAVRETFRGVLRELPYEAVTLFSQPEASTFDRMRIDTEHGRFVRSAGTLEGGALVFENERDLGTRILRTRHEFKSVTDSSFEVEFFLSPRDGSPWELVHRAVYTRTGD